MSDFDVDQSWEDQKDDVFNVVANIDVSSAQIQYAYQAGYLEATKEASDLEAALAAERQRTARLELAIEIGHRLAARALTFAIQWHIKDEHPGEFGECDISACRATDRAFEDWVVVVRDDALRDAAASSAPPPSGEGDE